MPRFIPCRVCRQPMRVSPGQIMLQHKRCKKLFGKFGRQKYVWDQKRKASLLPHSSTVKGTTSGSRERVDAHPKDPTVI